MLSVIDSTLLISQHSEEDKYKFIIRAIVSRTFIYNTFICDNPDIFMDIIQLCLDFYIYDAMLSIFHKNQTPYNRKTTKVALKILCRYKMLYIMRNSLRMTWITACITF